MPSNSSRTYREFRVRVTPHAKKEYVKEGAAGKFAVSVKAKAEEGRANERAIELMASHFSVPRKNVSIVKGASQPAKIIRVYGA